jgi:very-short-patch-repair endonuclease
MKQPEIVRKMISNKDLKAVGLSISRAIMKNPQERLRRKRQSKINFIPGWKKFNTKIPTPSESVLLAIFPESIHNFRINTGRSSKFEKVAHQYVIDAAWPNLKLAVEVDGSYHDWKSQKKKDLEKDNFLISNGWTVLRFSASSVLNDVLKVKKEIVSTILKLKNG